ncbi:GGDEF domain-containing protein [Herbivorax sp. ANBcel31]|uniref:GGDEF domain-containing protein n=1 Tax=Herbivorax sp. ANBcel31 TaxID=3069754 RepID=UPI0027B21A6F|nr:GGDEF domain-containing protein [Herbivorax sp. ANBcel31]MDQ2085056.1 GGDEF domain-containing protein [Herbivorax sp. ANBcel31]
MDFPKIINPYNNNISKNDLRFYLFSSHLYILCIVIHVALLMLFFFIEIYLMAIFNIFSCVIFTLNLILNKKGFLNLAYHFAIIEITLHAALATLCLGWESNFSFYSVAICSVIMFSTFLKLHIKIIEVALTSSLYLFVFGYILNNSTLYDANDLAVQIIGFINIIVIISLLTSIFYKFYLETYILNKKLKSAAETDSLTGVYNRSFFNEYVEIEIKRLLNELNYNTQAKQQVNLGIAIIDIDNFKKINDTYGHLTGDNVIVQVVEIIRKSVFSRDLICRYGGEEFVILFNRTSNDGAINTAERIRKEIEKHKFIFNDTVKNGKITISIGFASFDEIKSDSIESLLNLADTRLYKAKSSGKNLLIYN